MGLPAENVYLQPIVYHCQYPAKKYHRRHFELDVALHLNVYHAGDALLAICQFKLVRGSSRRSMALRMIVSNAECASDPGTYGFDIDSCADNYIIAEADRTWIALFQRHRTRIFAARLLAKYTRWERDHFWEPRRAHPSWRHHNFYLHPSASGSSSPIWPPNLAPHLHKKLLDIQATCETVEEISLGLLLSPTCL